MDKTSSVLFHLTASSVYLVERRVWTVLGIEFCCFGIVKGMRQKGGMIYIVAHGPEDGVGHAITIAAVGIKGRPVLPNGLTAGRYLKDTACSAFTDEGIAIGQPSGAADISGIKVHRVFCPIFPDDIIGHGINLDSPAEIRRKEIDGAIRVRGMEAAIVKDHNVPIGQYGGIMWKRYPMLGGIRVAVAKAPFHGLGRFVPNEYGR